MRGQQFLLDDGVQHINCRRGDVVGPVDAAPSRPRSGRRGLGLVKPKLGFRGALQDHSESSAPHAAVGGAVGLATSCWGKFKFKFKFKRERREANAEVHFNTRPVLPSPPRDAVHRDSALGLQVLRGGLYDGVREGNFASEVNIHGLGEGTSGNDALHRPPDVGHVEAVCGGSCSGEGNVFRRRRGEMGNSLLCRCRVS